VLQTAGGSVCPRLGVVEVDSSVGGIEGVAHDAAYAVERSAVAVPAAEELNTQVWVDGVDDVQTRDVRPELCPHTPHDRTCAEHYNKYTTDVTQPSGAPVTFLGQGPSPLI